jgi:beta-phosphoglucomutase-like phosphatase (HAD superfamily)
MTSELTQANEPANTRLLREQPDGPQHAKRRGFNTDEVLAEFQAFSRQPFVEILAELVSGIPTPEAIKTFAEDHPDRWANCVKTMANLAGFHDKLEIEGNIALDINRMGDAQLMERLDELGETIKSMGIKQGISDASYEDIPTNGGEKSTKKDGGEAA